MGDFDRDSAMILPIAGIMIKRVRSECLSLIGHATEVLHAHMALAWGTKNSKNGTWSYRLDFSSLFRRCHRGLKYGVAVLVVLVVLEVGTY